MIGTSLAGYRITEKIGDGGSSTVWKAEGSGRVVAIKVVSEEWNADAAKRKAFQQEGELTKRLRHPRTARAGAPRRLAAASRSEAAGNSWGERPCLRILPEPRIIAPYWRSEKTLP